jgi:predicted transcriptional regulator
MTDHDQKLIDSSFANEDLQYAIYVQQAIEAGIKDAEEGKVYTTEEVRKRLGLRLVS